MNEKEIKSILHSDMALWEAATEENGEKFLMLPYGIGRVAVSLEGIENGPKRAEAVGSFGAYIRGVVEDRVGDEAVEARALAALARSRDVAGELPVGGGGALLASGVGFGAGEVPQVSNQKAVAASNEVAFTPEGMASRAGAIRELITTYEEALTQLSLELRGVDAYLEAFNAPTDTKTPQSDQDGGA